MQQKKRMMYAASVLLIALVGLFAACRKKDDDKDTNKTEDTTYATDQNLAEKIFDDAQTLSDKGKGTTGSGSFKTTACGTVTHAPGTFTIDFGTANCLCSDGRNRRGKIIVTYTGNYVDSASSHTITFDNYYQNDNKVEGTKTITNMGHNSSGQPYFKVDVNGSITKPDGTVITADWDRVRTWVAGYTTLLNWTDDVYNITGSGTITRPAGTVNVNITSPLVVALDCRWIEAGSITYTLASGATRILNYGTTPTCDASATVTTASGATVTITLP